jgi:EPS-associated MarR family transcriptional regulator
MAKRGQNPHCIRPKNRVYCTPIPTDRIPFKPIHPMKPDLSDQYYLLKELAKAERRSQRELARELGLSLGKLNFILQALIAKGLVKMENFAQNDNKLQYRYLLTPKGIRERLKITRAFIQRKEAEYEWLRRELEEARQSVQN